MTWELSIAGLFVGALVGMTGMGGGSLMTPMLILIFGFNPKTAVGTDILHGAVFKSFGAIRHRQLGNVHVPLALSRVTALSASRVVRYGSALANQNCRSDGCACQPCAAVSERDTHEDIAADRLLTSKAATIS